MTSTTMKEQLNKAIASGALTVKKTAGTVVKQHTLPQWAVAARSQIIEVRSSADALKKMRSVDDPQFSVRLSALWGAADSIRQQCTAAAKESRSRELTAARRDAETVMNYVRTIQDGLSTRDIETAHFEEVSKTMRRHLRTLHTALGTLGHKVAPAARRPDILADDSMTHYRHASIKLERKSKANPEHPAFTVNIPILAVFEGVVPVQRLEAAGLPVESMGGYPVFLNQTVLCVRASILDKRGLDRTKYIETVLARVNERSGSKDVFVLATETGMANSRHQVYMYWLVPSKFLMEMQNTANSPLREWGLPFKG